MLRKSHLSQVREVQRIAIPLYVKGRHDKCWKAIWRKLILPRFGINYDTFLRYLRTDTDALDRQESLAEETGTPRP